MTGLEKFIETVRSEFSDDRLTYQKAVPTFHPESSEEASQFIKLANSEKQNLFITGFGNNIDPVDEPFKKMVSIRTDRLNKVDEINSDDFYVKIGSGFPFIEINKKIKQKNLFLPQSNLPYVGSVGGAIAIGLTSDYQNEDFPLKKYFIAAEIVTPTGEIITPGSVCFKSVAGYDIVRIFAGSWGLLGLIVSVTFRVMPSSAEHEFETMVQKDIDRENFLSGLDKANSDTDAVYSRKIKAKFDPNNILPIV